MSTRKTEIKYLKLPENYVNRAKPRSPQEPSSYSALRHRYNFGLMYQDIWEPQLLGPIYNAKYNIEYPEAVDYIKTIMRDFVEQREGKNRDRIMENIGINKFKEVLIADKFFVIDYHFLMMKFRLNVGGSPTKELKINALINNVLLPSYKAVRCIQNTSIIATNVLLNIRTLQGPANLKPVTSVLDIIIDEDLIEEIASEDVKETFNEHWETDESVKKIPETIIITPLMVLEYYVHKLNKLLIKLQHYKISINETLIKSLNQGITPEITEDTNQKLYGLKSLNKLIKEIYNYDPKWLVVEKKTRSLTKKKSKRSSKRVIKSI
jgi:hypothetical protein